jgi:tetratricopeptide (TPR) repeat protein
MDTEGAIEASRKAVKFQPDYGLAWDNLGSALMDRKEHAEAAKALERARELGAADLESVRRLSACYFNLSDLSNAERCLRDVLTAEPEDLETLSNLGAILIARKDFLAAKTVLTTAITLSPDHFGSAYHLGKVHKILGETEPSLRWLRRATSAQPRNAVGWRDLAEALHDAGEQQDAEVALERALALAPDAADIEELKLRIRGRDSMFAFQSPALPEAKSQETRVPEAKISDPGVVDLTILKIGS